MKRFSIILVFALLITQLAVAPAWAGTYQTDSWPIYYFSDVRENHWAFEAVSELALRGIVKGFPDGKFYHDLNVTREQLAVMIVMAAGLKPIKPDTATYKDVPLDYWAYPYIEAVKPYFPGYNSDRGAYFKPKSAAVREDVAAAIVRVNGYENDEPNLSKLDENFVDADQITPEVKKLVGIAVEKKLIKGYPDHTFIGKGNVTRAEAVTVIYNAQFFKSGESDGIVAVVNDEEITWGKLDSDFKKIKTAFILQGTTFDNVESQDFLNALQRNTLERIIDTTLINQAAKKEGVFPSYQDVAARIDEFKSRFGNESQFQEVLRRYNYTVQDLVYRASDDMAHDNLYEKVTDNITEEEIKKHYNSIRPLDGEQISLNEERENIILSIKQEKFHEYLERIRSEAKIEIYL